MDAGAGTRRPGQELAAVGNERNRNARSTEKKVTVVPDELALWDGRSHEVTNMGSERGGNTATSKGFSMV